MPHPSQLRTYTLAILASMLVVAKIGLSAPTGGGGRAAAGSQSSAGASSGGAPAAPSAFFSPSSMNFVRPSGGWANWSTDLPVLPKGEQKHVVYLCYERDNTTSDPNVPLALKLVNEIKDSHFPCYSLTDSKRPILRGDRLRIAINMRDPETKAFFENVSILNVNVVLTVVPPIQPALLRLNLGASATTGGLGGNQAPESATYRDPDYLCFTQILGFAEASPQACTGPKGSAKTILILPWPYTFPPDVIPSITISALYTTPDNGGPWQPRKLYPAGSIVQCPGEDQCVVASSKAGQLPGMLAGASGPTEPKWPGPNLIADGETLTWSSLLVTYRVDDAKGAHAPDGKPVYKPGERVVWNSGQQQIESTVEDWQATHWYVANQSVIICPPESTGFPLDHESLCVAKASGVSGATRPPSWNKPLVPDSAIRWAYDTGPPEPRRKRWEKNSPYQIGDKIRCEQASQKQNLCSASIGGYSGEVEPWWPQASAFPSAASAASPSPQRDNQVLWAPFTPSASTAAPASDQVAPMNVAQLPQVHGPSLWGISTALLYSTERVPNSYAFTQTVSAGCPSQATGSASITPCPTVATSYQRATDIALMISPYVFHHLYSKVSNAADGIDAERKWSFSHPEDLIPEPIFGFGLNSPGNNYYAGLSMELFVRDLQLIGGWAWIKAPFLTTPITAGGSPANTITPNTYTGFAHTYFVGLAFNLSGLVSGH
jgi:hypothetical protein